MAVAALPPPMRVHHVGVATEDAASLSDVYAAVLGGDAHRERLDGLDLWYLSVGDGYLELLEPVEGGTIARYLDGHGPGLHHVAFETSDVAAALDRARAAGVDLVDEEPREGGWGHRVAFLHPESTGGVLVEFVEAG
jgi:methylmalonyl-CoA/ethylmalonyl-CoA epimerase